MVKIQVLTVRLGGSMPALGLPSLVSSPPTTPLCAKGRRMCQKPRGLQRQQDWGSNPLCQLPWASFQGPLTALAADSRVNSDEDDGTWQGLWRTNVIKPTKGQPRADTRLALTPFVDAVSLWKAQVRGWCLANAQCSTEGLLVPA